MLIIGMRFVTWGSAGSGRRMHCGNCVTVGEFIDRKGMRFITLFFIPVIPISGTKHLLQCPTCGTRYRAE